MRMFNSQIVSGGTVGTASFVSSSFWSTDIIRTSFQIVISSGTCNGTFVVQGSNDINRGLPAQMFTPTNWNNLGSVSTLVVSTSAPGAQSFLIPQFECSYEYLRVSFTAANGGAALGLVDVRGKGFSI